MASGWKSRINYVKVLTADTTPVSQAGVTIVEYRDFSGGLNTIDSPLNLADNELAEVFNLKYSSSQYGIALESRGGLEAMTTTGIGGAIKDLGYYVDAVGSEHYLAVATSLLWEANTATTVWTWTSIATLESDRGRMAAFANKMVIADGERLKYINGSTIYMCHDAGGYLFNTAAAADVLAATSISASLNTGAGQEFTTPDFGSTGLTLPLVDLTFWMSKAGAPTGDVTGYLYNATTGVTVATSTTISAEDLDAAGAEVTLPFSAGYLESATAYRATANYLGGDTTDYVAVHYSTIYTGGDGMHCYLTGTTWTTLAGGDTYWKLCPNLPPKADMVEARNNRLFCNDTVDGQKNWLHYCNNNDLNQWSGTGAGIIICETMSQITAMKNFYNILLIHCGTAYKSVSALSGTDPSTWSSSLVKAGIGAINQDVCWNVGNDFLFLDDSGVVSLIGIQNFGDIERSIRSAKVKNIVNPSVSSGSFAGYCSADQQYWLDVGNSDYFMVYDVELKIWTKYKFELGTGITPTVFSEWNGYSWIGDSAGNLWRMNNKSPNYYDNAVDYTQCMKTKSQDFRTMRDKHARFVTAHARSKLGGSYVLNFYKNLGATAFTSIPINMVVDPDVTVDEATMTVGEATFAVADVGVNLWEYPVDFEFKSLQLGIENIDTLNRPMLVFGVALDAAILSRT
jgi:hypothetical protein